MKKLLLVLFILTTLLLPACSSDENDEIPENAYTIDGTYYSEELSIGYLLNKNGFGIQYIFTKTYMIKYYITDDIITIDNFTSDGSNITEHSFEKGNDYIKIDGLKFDYTEIPDESSGTS